MFHNLGTFLLGQIFRVLNWGDHSLHCEEGRQIGSVRADDDQREEPPNPAHDPCGGGLGVETRSLAQECPRDEPERVGN